MIQKIKVGSMSCEHCKKRIENAFSSAGYTADADIKTGVVTVEGDDLQPSQLKNIVEELGFDFLSAE